MKPIDLSRITTDDLPVRPSKVFADHLGRPNATGGMTAWLDSLPKQLAANSLRKLRDHLLRAKRDGRPVAAALGGHVIKTGCAPYLIDLIRRGVVTAVAMNGSAAIHDFELAFAGRTSEDVAPQLDAGRFGMARETAEAIAVAARYGSQTDVGLGRGLGRYLDECDCRYPEASLVLAAYRAGIPCTVHVAVGTDIVHMHPNLSGANLGEATLTDFRILCAVVADMAYGVWMNLGSAVILPEVFLKAVAVARNLGHDLDGMVSVNLDKESRYRTMMNVLTRPAQEGLEIIGHHEIMIPMVHSITVEALAISTSRAA